MPELDPTTTTRALLAEAKGILAADESVKTITKRFEAIGIVSEPDSRRAWRELLFTTPELERSISGVILHEETLGQEASTGVPVPVLLEERGIVPGIKVDTGTTALALHAGEQVTQGLDGLRERLAGYVALGARFAKWRAVLTIGDGRPSPAAVAANAHALARYAALCQEVGVVPIVEPEVLMDGDHTLEQCRAATEATLQGVFAELERQGVDLPTMILKASMVIAGSASPAPAGVDDVADATLACLRATVPEAVPGVAFLSGGQGPDLATEHLDAMNRRGPQPWTLTFSYGRALQDDALVAWKGEPANVEAAQAALAYRAKANSAACTGSYDPASGAG